MKPLIVHISNDYPNPLLPETTAAIRNLVEATPEFRHVVYALNRVNGLGGIADIPFGEDRTAVAYGALPKGLLWERRLDEVAAWIIADLKKKKIMPDLVEAHKFTIEGLIGQRLAAEFSCPLICYIQGKTDVKILKIKTGLRARYRSIADRAARVFSYSHWAVAPFEKLLGMPAGKCACLPVLPGFDMLSPSAPAGADRLVTLIRFGDWKNKNIAGLTEAMRRLSVKRPALTLDVYGGGRPESLFSIKKDIAKAGMAGRIVFKGPVANDRLPRILGQYSALVMPSFVETYGLVYAEAMFCGIPVLFSKDRAIDGYFDARSIGYACDPASNDDIAAGIDYLLTNEGKLKTGLAGMQRDGSLDIIRRDGILKTYRDGIAAALSGGRFG